MIYQPDINAGDLNTRIRIQYKLSKGSGSFKTEEWADIGNNVASDPPRVKYAKWVGVHGSEAWAAESVQAERAATVTIRFDKLVNEACRILNGNIVYKIVSMDDIGQKHRWLELKVKAEVKG